MVNTSSPHHYGQNQEFGPSQTMCKKKYYNLVPKSLSHVEERLLYRPRKSKLLGHQNLVNMGMVCLELREKFFNYRFYKYLVYRTAKSKLLFQSEFLLQRDRQIKEYLPNLLKRWLLCQLFVFELETSNLGYLLILKFSLTVQSFRKIGQTWY